MIYLTGDCPPRDLKLICPNCRVLLKAVDCSGPDDSYKTAYLCCHHDGCRHYGINRVRYSWPLPPLYYQDANFWCQADFKGGAYDAKTDDHFGGTAPPKSGNDGGHSNKVLIEDANLGPILVEKGTDLMGDKTPQLMHQLSTREKMIYSLYAAARKETPLQILYSVPVGHEFLEAPGVEPAKKIPDTDPRLFRIDVVEVYEDHNFLIEVKTRADLKAYGQLLAYVKLYVMHYHPTMPVIPLLVFEEASQITMGVCLQDEIPLYPVSIDTALKTPADTETAH